DEVVLSLIPLPPITCPFLEVRVILYALEKPTYLSLDFSYVSVNDLLFAIHPQRLRCDVLLPALLTSGAEVLPRLHKKHVLSSLILFTFLFLALHFHTKVVYYHYMECKIH